MQLSLQNFTTLVQNAAATVQGAAKQLVDLTVGSVLRVILEASASVGLWLQYLVLLVLQTTRLATSTGTDVDSFIADFGLTRLAAVAATGSVTFSRASTGIAAFVPVGATVLTLDQTQTFTVVADTANPAYVATPTPGFNIASGTVSLTCTVQAVNAGTVGNVLAATIGLISSAIPGVDTVTNSAAFTNGENAETDAAVRARFQNFLATRAEATVAAVDYAISSVQSGLTYVVTENVNSLAAYDPGNFVVYVDDGSGAPPSTLLTAVSLAIDAIRPIGSTFNVLEPTKVGAAVTLTITVAAGAIKANLIGPTETAVTAFINALPMGAILPWSRIAQVAYDSSSSITNVSAVAVNGATADIGGLASQVVRATSVVVS